MLDRPPAIPLWRRPGTWLYRGLPLVDPDEDRKLTFDAYVADGFGALGPVTALGDPGDYLAPTGAARYYANDADWQVHAAALIERCRCILTVACAPTEALTWELDHVRRRGACGRLFVFVGPGTLQGGTWSAFARELDELGYDMFAGPPAPGALLAFDRSGRAQELITGARSPSDYVTAITHRLQLPGPR